jgi:hypothetical protein
MLVLPRAALGAHDCRRLRNPKQEHRRRRRRFEIKLAEEDGEEDPSRVEGLIVVGVGFGLSSGGDGKGFLGR